MATRTLVQRVTSIPSANAISAGLTAQGGSPKQYFIKNLSGAGVSIYVADQTTAGAAPTVATNIPVNCTDYITIANDEERFFASTTPVDVFVQASTGTTGVVEITFIN